MEGYRKALMAHPALLLATDGALWQRAGGGGIVFYTPGAGVVLRAWFGCLVWASPSSMEWLTRLVALSLLDGWKGMLLSSPDDTSALFRSYTRAPPKFTILDALWRHLVPTLLHLKAHHKLWLRAQHDTSDEDTLALLNSMAHSLTTRGAHAATPWTVPLLPHLHRRLVLFHCGALLVDPDLGLDAADRAATSAAYFTARREACLRPDGADLLALLEGDRLATVAVKRAFAYRVLEWQPPPALDVPMECHFCAFTHPQLARHVRSRCMPAYQRPRPSSSGQSPPPRERMRARTAPCTLLPAAPYCDARGTASTLPPTSYPTPSPCLASGTPPTAQTTPRCHP